MAEARSQKRAKPAKHEGELRHVNEGTQRLLNSIKKKSRRDADSPNVDAQERDRLMALHEAAHAIAVLAAGGRLRRMALGPIRAPPSRHEFGKSAAWLGGLVEHEPLHRRVVAFVALCGAAAHRLFVEERPKWYKLLEGPTANDYEDALSALLDLQIFDSYRVEGAAWLFVHLQRRVIEALAEELLLHRSMSGDAVTTFVDKVDPGISSSIPIEALIDMHDTDERDPPSER